MYGSKELLMSKTFWGIVAAIILGNVGRVSGVEIPYSLVLELGALMFAVYGRISAVKNVTFFGLGGLK